MDNYTQKPIYIFIGVVRRGTTEVYLKNLLWALNSINDPITSDFRYKKWYFFSHYFWKNVIVVWQHLWMHMVTYKRLWSLHLGLLLKQSKSISGHIVRYLTMSTIRTTSWSTSRSFVSYCLIHFCYSIVLAEVRSNFVLVDSAFDHHSLTSSIIIKYGKYIMVNKYLQLPNYSA